MLIGSSKDVSTSDKIVKASLVQNMQEIYKIKLKSKLLILLNLNLLYLNTFYVIIKWKIIYLTNDCWNDASFIDEIILIKKKKI